MSWLSCDLIPLVGLLLLSSVLKVVVVPACETQAGPAAAACWIGSDAVRPLVFGASVMF